MPRTPEDLAREKAEVMSVRRQDFEKRILKEAAMRREDPDIDTAQMEARRNQLIEICRRGSDAAFNAIRPRPIKAGGRRDYWSNDD